MILLWFKRVLAVLAALLLIAAVVAGIQPARHAR
jgi:hypothetical protein